MAKAASRRKAAQELAKENSEKTVDILSYPETAAVMEAAGTTVVVPVAFQLNTQEAAGHYSSLDIQDVMQYQKNPMIAP